MPLFRRSRPLRSAPEAIDAAEAALEDGEPEEALRHADDGVAAARAADAGELLGAALVTRAASLFELGRFQEALKAADDACRVTPDDPAAWYERALAGYRLAGFQSAAEHALQAVDLAPDDAHAWHLLGRLRTWLDDTRGADEAMRRAAALAPAEYVKPVRIAAGEFDRIAAEVWRGIPSRFRARMGNTLAVAEELPDPDEVAGGFDPDTLGVYEGGTALHDDAPERIVLFQRNHEAICGSLGDLMEEVRRTLLHEVGHHFGMEEEDLPY